MRKIALVSAIAFGLGVVPAVADYVTGLDPEGDNFLALRSGPGGDFAMLRRLGPDTVVEVLEEHGAWRRVRLEDGASGWAFGKYIAPGAPPGHTHRDVPVLSGDLYGQTGAARLTLTLLDLPASGSRVTGRLRTNGGLIVLARTAGWLRVLTEGGETGYVRAADVAIGAPPVPPARSTGKKSAP